MRHAAIVRISNGLLLNLMDLEGGTIRHVYTKDEYLDPQEFYIIVEHPDLPEVPTGEMMQEVQISLQTTYNEFNVPTKIERVDPPKGVEK